MATSLSFDPEIGLLLNAANSLILVSQLDALVEKCAQRLRFLLGEWFLDTTQGVPYLQQIYASGIDPTLIVTILNTELLKESAITGISDEDFTFEESTGAFTYSASITSSFGTTTLNVST